MAIGIGDQCDIVEVGVALGLREKICGRVEDRTHRERDETREVRRLGLEATQPRYQKRKTLESDQNVEHVLEEVESGGAVDDDALVKAREETECELEIVRRESDKWEGEDKRHEDTVERVNAQILVDGLITAANASNYLG